MNFFRRKPEVKGYIGSYNLRDWWLATFTEEERAHMDDTYAPMSGGMGGISSRKGVLTQGEIYPQDNSTASFLWPLAGWFKKTPADRDIARRILKKAIDVSDPKKDILALHFAYSELVQVWYRDRDNLPNALDEAIRACLMQIALSSQAAKQFKKEYPKQPLPRHVGYDQLLVIYKKQKRYDDVIELAQYGKQNWPEDGWDDVIEEAEKKKAKEK